MRILETINQKEAILELLNRRMRFQNEAGLDLTTKIKSIIDQVKESGDHALCDFTAKFDQVQLSPKELKVSENDFEEAYTVVSQTFIPAIRQAYANILEYHTKQLPKDWLDLKEDGIILGQRYLPVASAGLYVPGGIAGTTPLVSSLLMNAIPAIVAGVKRIIICTPPDRRGKVNDYLLVAARECGISEVYKAGGAQAIAAMAYGTETIKPVDVIVGPGNQYVTEAKRQVFGRVGLDILAGPSEILIIADANNKAEFIAADLLSQAEHGPVNEAGAFLLTDSAKLAQEVVQALEIQLEDLPRNEIARASLELSGGIIVTQDLMEAVELANFAAPEHMELLVPDPWNFLGQIKNAGAIFIGPYSTEPIGDYVAGTNHVLPTNSTARFASGLSVDNFMKKTSIISYNQAGINKYGKAAITIAEVEGLDAHAQAVRIRLT
jgi:histidinol dehydrogenase